MLGVARLPRLWDVRLTVCALVMKNIFQKPYPKATPDRGFKIIGV
jgi:hypothetical protein